MLGMYAGTAEALPVYLQAPTDAYGNITLLTGESVTVDLYLSGASLPQSNPAAPLTGYGFNLDLGSGLTGSVLAGNPLYGAAPMSNFLGQGWDHEFIPTLAGLTEMGNIIGGGALPDVLLASFELVASEVGSFTFDVNGGVFFGEPIAALFDLGAEITVNVVPEPGTWLLMATGLLGMMFWARRKKAQGALIETA